MLSLSVSVNIGYGSSYMNGIDVCIKHILPKRKFHGYNHMYMAFVFLVVQFRVRELVYLVSFIYGFILKL